MHVAKHELQRRSLIRRTPALGPLLDAYETAVRRLALAVPLGRRKTPATERAQLREAKRAAWCRLRPFGPEVVSYVRKAGLQ